jgi:hypothetical protein
MRWFSTFILFCAIAGTAANAATARSDRCPDGLCAPQAVAPPADFPIDARPIARVVNAVGSARALGTGTLVDVDGEQGLVLTCAHLFREGTGSVAVTFPDGSSYAARLARIDAAADLAALAIRAPNVRPVELADDCPQRGDPLVSCGYGSDGRLWCNRGQALGYVTMLGSHGRETLELTGAARFGDSGGPVLDRDGRIVAVLFGTNGRVVDGTFCGRIRHFLEGLSARFCKRPNAQPARPLPGPVDPGGALAKVPPKPQPPAADIAQAPQAREPRPPAVELPPGLDAIGDAPGALERIAQPWLAEKLAALLAAFGVPGGIAGVAGGAIVWLVMRRGKKKLQTELDRLKTLLGEPAGDAPAAASVVERHHNRYVPYEVSVLDKAWATAHARVGERYPGAVPYLKIVEGIKDQLLSGADEAQVA